VCGFTLRHTKAGLEHDKSASLNEYDDENMHWLNWELMALYSSIMDEVMTTGCLQHTPLINGSHDGYG
jgi:hypothetical protein